MMDPMTFVTLLGHLITFQSIVDSKKETKKLNDFIEWLKQNRHEDLASTIKDNEDLKNSLTAYMDQNHNEIITQLNNISEEMLTLSSRMQGLSQITAPFLNKGNAELSEQAIDLLRQFLESGGATMIAIEDTSGRGRHNYKVIRGNDIIYKDDLTLFKDDMKELIKRDLVKKEKTTSKWHSKYSLQRSAYEYFKKEDKQ